MLPMNDIMQSQKLTPIPSPTSYKGPGDQLWLGFQRTITNQILKDINCYLVFFFLIFFTFSSVVLLFVFAFLLDFPLENWIGLVVCGLQERSDYNDVTFVKTYIPKTILLLVNKSLTSSVPLSFYVNTNKIILWILAISLFSKCRFWS